jgi:MSHA biogenesis protein MshI
VKQQIELVERAGLDLGVIDIPELALRNVAALLETEGRGTALLHLGDRRSTLLLVRQGVLYLMRHVETGALTLADAGEMRGELVVGLALEVRRSLDYIESHYEHTSIPQLHTSGLEEADRAQLARELGIPVSGVDVAALFETTEVVSPQLQRLCLPAVGAALRRDPVAL